MPKPNVKEQIVTASLKLLHSNGFNATSVQDITAAAGVPKGSFYNHFASKEALALDVLQRYGANVAGLRGVLADTTLTAKVRLQRYFSTLIAANADAGFNCGCMLGNFSTELSQQIPAMRVALSLSYDEWNGTLATVIAEGQRDGSIATVHPAEALAAFTVDAWEGAVAHSKAAHSQAPLDRFLTMMLSRILA